jgi:antitoxin component YwqK of YwqJK toxin-antitoxin module
LGSTHINHVDQKGRKQGAWKVYDANGELKYRGNYVDGKPVGEFVYYYPDGLKKAIVNNLDSGKISYIRMFHKDGKLMAEGKYIDKLKDSTWLYYSGEDGTLTLEEQYDLGVKQGNWKTYYPSGQVMEVVHYKDDQKEGPWIQYFSDGSMKAEGTYINGELEGLFVLKHMNGNVEVSGTYRKGKKEDTWVHLNEIGELIKKEVYKNGVLIKSEEKVPDEE